MSDTVRVAYAAPVAAVSYDVVVRPGAAAALPALLAQHAPAARYAVISPEDVARLHGGRIMHALRAAGCDASLLTIPPGEAHKTREAWGALTDALLAAGYGRDCCIIALGGGVAGDLAGFVAATYMRGVPLVQVPTTLLAMIDASVGGKTGVDTPAGKNMVGAFHAPALVVADPLLLDTLPDAELRSGMAEAVKHGAMLDARYFDWMARHAADLLAREPDCLVQLVQRSVELKAGVVAHDPLERGMRAVLNFGHTVGHALERHASWTLRHGFAVAAGMVVEARAGEVAGITEHGTADRVAALLRTCGLPEGPAAAPLADLLPAMRLDKKSRAGIVRCALPRCVGEPARDGDTWTFAVPEPALEAAFSAVSRNPRNV